jgi:hypothetical protein
VLEARETRSRGKTQERIFWRRQKEMSWRYRRTSTDGNVDLRHITITRMIMLQSVNPAAGRCKAKAPDSILCLSGLSVVGLLRCCIHFCIWMTVPCFVPCLHFTSILVASRCICTRYFLLRTKFSYDMLVRKEPRRKSEKRNYRCVGRGYVISRSSIHDVAPTHFG